MGHLYPQPPNPLPGHLSLPGGCRGDLGQKGRWVKSLMPNKGWRGEHKRPPAKGMKKPGSVALPDERALGVAPGGNPCLHRLSSSLSTPCLSGNCKYEARAETQHSGDGRLHLQSLEDSTGLEALLVSLFLRKQVYLGRGR